MKRKQSRLAKLEQASRTAPGDQTPGPTVGLGELPSDWEIDLLTGAFPDMPDLGDMFNDMPDLGDMFNDPDSRA